MEEILLKKAKLIVDPVNKVKRDVDILIREDKIEKIGDGLSSNGWVIDCSNSLVIPCFFNGHTHSPMSLLRGMAEDLPLHTWLSEKIWPLERLMEDEHYYIGAKFSAMEMLKSGFSGCADMYFKMENVAKAFEEINFRGVLCEGVFDFFDKRSTDEQASKAIQAYKKLANLNSKLIKPCLGPHSTYTCSKELLQIIADYSKEYNALVQIHVAESQEEQRLCVERYGVREVELLNEIGLCNNLSIYAHGVWFDEKEIELLKQKDVAVVQNTISNLKLAVGSTCDLKRMLKEGIRCCLGTDGPASNNSLDALEMMKMASLIQKHMHKDPSAISAREIFKIATYNAYRIFFQEFKGGLIEEGAVADVAIFDLTDSRLKPLNRNEEGHVINHLVYSCSGIRAKHVIVNGKISVLDYKLAREREEEIIDRFEKSYERLVSKIL